MVEIYAVKLDKKIDDLKYNKLMTLVSQEKRNRIERFHRFEDAERTLMADILIRYLLYEKLSLKENQLVFVKNEYGKPFLKNIDLIHFNVSHSGEWVVCAIHDFPVGIDIEAIQSIDLDIAERFFSKDEFNDLMTKDKMHRLSYFYDLWTLKESYIKAVGKGMSISLDTFSIGINGWDITVKSNSELVDYYFKLYNIADDYKMAVCTKTKEFPKNVIIKNSQEVYEDIMKAYC